MKSAALHKNRVTKSVNRRGQSGVRKRNSRCFVRGAEPRTSQRTPKPPSGLENRYCSLSTATATKIAIENKGGYK